MDHELVQLVYVSTATTHNLEPELRNIQSTAVRFNSPADITGVLLYRSGRFIQLLEGPAPKVDTLYRSISGDPRHTDVTLLVRRPASARSASAWSMGVLNLDGIDADFEPIFEQISELGKTSHDEADPARAGELIRLMTAMFAGHAEAA
jgi:hypothetical protein